MPKASKDKAGKHMRHNPLAEEILETEGKRNLRRTPHAKARRATEDEEETDVIPANITKKLLDVAQAQKLDEDDDALPADNVSGYVGSDGAQSDGDMDDIEVDEDGFVLSQNATEEEEQALKLFLPGSNVPKPGLTLADVIMQKIEEQKAKQQHQESRDASEALSPKVMEVYGDIGKYLRHFKLGKIPKAFKVIPSLTNWEEVLSLTNPLNWSPAAMYEAVKIFASNLNPQMAQRFFNLVLLPAVRQNIADHGKLNFHYYRSLRKSLFKPAAFFKGLLLPLAMESCTLREAVILSSVLGKASIPPMHAAATIARLCTMTPWYGTTSILLAALVNKKYTLPLKVIESLVMHFAAFGHEESVLPLLWHKALLLFIQRYKFDLSEDQKRRLRELLRVHTHPTIGSEIRRELLAPKPGGAPTQEPAAMDVS